MIPLSIVSSPQDWDGGASNRILTADHYYNKNNDEGSGNQLIECPACKMSITVKELHEHVNANPEGKKDAIEKERAMWGLTHYDMAYYLENIVFCPSCARISHLGDWLATTTTG